MITRQSLAKLNSDEAGWFLLEDSGVCVEVKNKFCFPGALSQLSFNRHKKLHFEETFSLS